MGDPQRTIAGPRLEDISVTTYSVHTLHGTTHCLTLLAVVRAHWNMKHNFLFLVDDVLNIKGTFVFLVDCPIDWLIDWRMD